MKKTILMAALMCFAISTFAQSNVASKETKKKPKTEKTSKKKSKTPKKSS